MFTKSTLDHLWKIHLVENAQNAQNDAQNDGKMRKMMFIMSHYSEKLGFLKLQYNEQIKLQTS